MTDCIAYFVFSIPSYNEIVNQNEDEDEEFEKAEEFERKYNFRYQEPDAEFVREEKLSHRMISTMHFS